MDPLTSQILIKKESNLATITLNRPPANSYYLEYLQHIAKTIDEIDQDPKIKVVLINSSSEKFFCAGADIKIFSANSTEENLKMVDAAREVSAAITSSNKIFIAAIAGHCLGGGLEIALACDLRLAAEGKYLIGLPEVKLGSMPGNGGTPRLIELIGMSRAMELVVTGDSIGPQQAYEFGLFNQLYAKKDFEDQVNIYLNKLTSGPGKAMSAIKQFVQAHKGLNMQRALDLETNSAKALYNTPDAIEGFRAFTEKRDPKFE